MKDSSNNIINGLSMIVSTIVNSCMQEQTKAQCIAAVFQGTNIMLSSDDAERADKNTQIGEDYARIKS